VDGVEGRGLELRQTGAFLDPSSFSPAEPIPVEDSMENRYQPYLTTTNVSFGHLLSLSPPSLV
jgi:hypothetical protein